MDKHEVDEAFEWLTVIFGVVMAILIQYPEYFYYTTPGHTPAPLKAAIAVVPPMVITVVIWLIGKLAGRSAVRALAKISAWMLMLGTTWTNLCGYSFGVMSAGWGIVPSSVLAGMSMLGFLLFSPVVAYFVVVPRYREVYPDVLLLQSKWRLAIIYVVTQVLVLLDIAAYVTPN